ncbi:MAG: hypothetical protein LCH89_00235 [Proteobacteria bacterium]|nr:hypothetical protein [Pseudomonadota bacterium]
MQLLSFDPKDIPEACRQAAESTLPGACFTAAFTFSPPEWASVMRGLEMREQGGAIGKPTAKHRVHRTVIGSHGYQETLVARHTLYGIPVFITPDPITWV